MKGEWLELLLQKYLSTFELWKYIHKDNTNWSVSLPDAGLCCCYKWILAKLVLIMFASIVQLPLQPEEAKLMMTSLIHGQIESSELSKICICNVHQEEQF